MAGEPTNKVYMEPGGDKMAVASGGEIDVKTGGKILANGTQASAIADLTHAVGTADGTVDDVGAAFSQATLNNNFKELTSKLASVLAALRGAGIIVT